MAINRRHHDTETPETASVSGCFQCARMLHTRKKDELNLPKCRLKIGQRSFAFRGAKSYNDLPDDIKKTRDTKHFKKNLYNYLLKL